MEEWEDLVIKNNLPKLIDITLCNTDLLARLHAKDVLSRAEMREIHETPISTTKAFKLYDVLVRKENAYQLMLSACKEARQTGVVSILEKGIRKRKPIKAAEIKVVTKSNAPAEASPKLSLDITSPLEVASSNTVNEQKELNSNNELSKRQKDDLPETGDKDVSIPGPSPSVFLDDRLSPVKDGDRENSSTRSAFQYFQNLSSNPKKKLTDSLGKCHIRKSDTNLPGMTTSNTDQKLPASKSFTKVEKIQPVLAVTSDHPTNEVTKKEYSKFTMTEWQRLNLPMLLNDSQCNKALLPILVAKKLISNEERIKIESIPDTHDKVDFLHKIILTRQNGYKELLEASREVKQSGVSQISINAEKELCIQSALVECNVREFKCRGENNTDLSDFHSISLAIAEYVDAEKLHLVLKTELLYLRGPNNETYFHVAAAYGYVNLIDYLIEKGLKISTVDDDGQTAGNYVGKFTTNIIETLKTLINHGLNLRQTNENGLTILSTVVLHGIINQYHFHHLVEYIIKIGNGDVFTQKCKEGATPLHHALEMLDLEKETIDLILNSTKININLADNLGRIPLHYALMHGRSLKTIKVLIELGADYKMKDGKNEGALHFAARGSNKKVIGFLGSLKLDINEVDDLGETPIHKVRFTKSREFFGMTKFLLDIGAGLSARDKNGNNVAHLFAHTENISLEEFRAWAKGMINIGQGHIFAAQGQDGKTPLQTAMARMDLDKNTIKMLLESSKVDTNQTDEEGDTLLLLALRFGRCLETIKSLISLGADIKIKNENGDGVLHLAVVGGNKEVIQYLISKGLKINERNEDRNTPLHLVSQTRSKNYFKLTKLLLENGADLYSKDKYGDTLAHEMADSEDVSCDDFKIWVTAMIENGHAQLFTIRGKWDRTPLHWSMWRKDLDLETIKLILESAKLDINQPDDLGKTILHLALEYGRSIDTIKNLVELGADWKKKGTDGRSVLHCAVRGSNKEAFLYFKSLGADVNAKDYHFQTPLHCVRWTRDKDYLGMTKLLLENGADLNAKDEFGNTLDQFMSSWLSAKEYVMWKEGMIKLGHSSLFQK